MWLDLNFENPFFNVLFITGICIFVVSLIFYFFPPKKINYLYGFRTQRSMKNQDNWDFAQKHSSRQLIFASISMLMISMVGLFIKSTEMVWMWFGLATMTWILIFLCFRTESALKKFENKKP